MGNQIVVDTSDFDRGIAELLAKMPQLQKQATNDVATEILRLSQFEVPHDTGLLQNSGHTEQEDEGAIVGYNKVYAARLHEHPEYHFQKGRKGKYLEDPIKNNIDIFLKIVSDTVN
jgi:hypothetical protein